MHSDLDSSGDGKLSHDELEQALVELDIDITTSQAHALVMFMGEPSLVLSTYLCVLPSDLNVQHEGASTLITQKQSSR